MSCVERYFIRRDNYEIKRVKTFDADSLECSGGYLRQRQRQNRHQRGGDPLRRHFRLSFRAERQRINLWRDLRAREYIYACIMRSLAVSRAHESLYVAQGCSSSGSFTVSCSSHPPPTRIYISDRSVVPPCNA